MKNQPKLVIIISIFVMEIFHLTCFKLCYQDVLIYKMNIFIIDIFLPQSID